MAKVFKYGDSIDTDVILPARYLALYDPKDLAAHCMEDIDKEFSKDVQKGDILVAGENFGCGSSREHAPISIKASGISYIIAASFARIFYRNCINIGLPIIESRKAATEIQNGDILDVDYKSGKVINLSQETFYKINNYPTFIQNIINYGGLLPSIKLIDE